MVREVDMFTPVRSTATTWRPLLQGSKFIPNQAPGYPLCSFHQVFFYLGFHLWQISSGLEWLPFEGWALMCGLLLRFRAKTQSGVVAESLVGAFPYVRGYVTLGILHFRQLHFPSNVNVLNELRLGQLPAEISILWLELWTRHKSYLEVCEGFILQTQLLRGLILQTSLLVIVVLQV